MILEALIKGPCPHMEYEIKSERMTYMIAPTGCELVSAKDIYGKEYIWNAKPSVWGKHSPILFPICGRLKNGKYTYLGKEYSMKAHGFFSSSLPILTEKSESKASFLLNANEETMKIYPFDFSLEVTYTASNSSLTVSTRIKNNGNNVMPFMYGAHPGFSLPLDDGLTLEDHRIDFGKEELLLHRLEPGGAFVLPKTENYTLKDGIYALSEEDIKVFQTLIFSEMSPHIRLFSPLGKHSIEMQFDENFKYFALWKTCVPGADYICLEPWTGIPSDGLSDECFDTRAQMIRLSPMESKALEYTITFN